MKKTLVNTETDKNVDEFIEGITNEIRKADAKIILQLLKDITGTEPKIWGKGIVAFGKYKYKRKNGEEYEWFNVGFSPGSKHLSLYVMYDVNQEQELLSKLGPHKTGKGCLYIKRLKDVDIKVVRSLLTKRYKWKR